MHRLMRSACVVLAIFAGLAWVPVVRADDRSADKILEELKAVVVPEFNPKLREDPKALQEFIATFRKASAKRADLIGELYQIDPENAQLPTLMGERWQVVVSRQNGEKVVNSEIDEILANSKNEKLKIEGGYWKARLPLLTRNGDPATNLKLVEDFIKRAPKDDRGALLLFMAANQSHESKEKAALLKKIVENYPDNRFATMARGTLKKLDSVGKPFELEFNEAIKGTSISMKELRGKVVVVDFWATWCGPCVAEMPTMKTLYAKYRNKGVEFIGVSLDQPEDQGGLEKLKDFVAKNQISWPQYYQGKGWESAFSASWGVDSIPCVFVVDQEGKLFSLDARGKLEEMIPELLEKNKPKNAAEGS